MCIKRIGLKVIYLLKAKRYVDCVLESKEKCIAECQSSKEELVKAQKEYIDYLEQEIALLERKLWTEFIEPNEENKTAIKLRARIDELRAIPC